mgnify:CR=1 FL=1
MEICRKSMKLTESVLIYLKEEHKIIINNIDNYYLYDGIFIKDGIIGLYNRYNEIVLTFTKDGYYNWLKVKKLQKIKYKICGVIMEENLKL